MQFRQHGQSSSSRDTGRKTKGQKGGVHGGKKAIGVRFRVIRLTRISPLKPPSAWNEEKLEYLKPAETAHYNFRNLPLEIFDHAPDFEVKTPQEWMEEADLNHYRTPKGLNPALASFMVKTSLPLCHTLPYYPYPAFQLQECKK